MNLEDMLEKLPPTIEVIDKYRMWCEDTRKQNAYLRIVKFKSGAWCIYYESAFTHWCYSKGDKLTQVVSQVLSMLAKLP